MNRITLKHLSKAYNGKIILKDQSYEFCSDHCYLIKGESGAGKTTLLNMIAGFVRPDEGMLQPGPGSKIDYMMQTENLFSGLTVGENLALRYYGNHPEEQHYELQQVLRDQAELIRSFRLEKLTERKVYNLSGGEKQRVRLVGQIISRANVLLLDEPVTGLDEDNAKIMTELIEKTVPGRIIIVVSHEALPFTGPVVRLTLKGGILYEEN